MNFPGELHYTKTHEWVKSEDKALVVGITEHAQQELRDVVFVDLPKVGQVISKGDAIAVVESVKAAFDIYAPLSGTILRVNDAIVDSPEIVNNDCYGQGWFFAIEPSVPDNCVVPNKSFTTYVFDVVVKPAPGTTVAVVVIEAHPVVVAVGAVTAIVGASANAYIVPFVAG